MFTETKTNLLVVSGALERRFPHIYELFWRECEKNKIEFHAISDFNGTSENIWVKDFLPIQVNGHFVKFQYGYGKDNPQFPQLKVSRQDWTWLSPVKQSKIRLDGGNCQREGEWVVMTDIIFQHNPSWKPVKLLAELERLFQAQIVVIPPDPSDNLTRPEGIGHSDGLVHFVPGTNKILVDDFWSKCKSSRGRRYFDELVSKLDYFDVILMPNATSKSPSMTEKEFRKKYPEADTFNSGFGYFINFAVVGNLLFMPTFDISDDEKVAKLLRKHFPKQKIIMADCRDLSMQGGLCNCICQSYVSK